MQNTPEIWSLIFSYCKLQDLLQWERLSKTMNKCILQFAYLSHYLNCFEYYTNRLEYQELLGKAHNKWYCETQNLPSGTVPAEYQAKTYHRLALINSTVNVQSIPIPRSAKMACKLFYSLHVKLWSHKSMNFVQQMPSVAGAIEQWHAYYFLVAFIDSNYTIHIGDLSSCQWMTTISVPGANLVYLSHLPLDYKTIGKTMKGKKYQCFRLYVVLDTKLQLFQVIDETTSNGHQCTISPKQEWPLASIQKVTCCHNLTFVTDYWDHLFILDETSNVTCIGENNTTCTAQFPLPAIRTVSMHGLAVTDVTRQHILYDTTPNTFLSVGLFTCPNSFHAFMHTIQVELNKQGAITSVALLHSFSYPSFFEFMSNVFLSPSGYFFGGDWYNPSYGAPRFISPVSNPDEYPPDEDRYVHALECHEKHMLAAIQSPPGVNWRNFESQQSKDLNLPSSTNLKLCISAFAGIPLVAMDNSIYIGFE